jgi:WD40 repeat protein/serine/threonine protein kinase
MILSYADRLQTVFDFRLIQGQIVTMPDGVSLDTCSPEDKSSPSAESFEEQHTLVPQTPAELESSVVDEEQQTILPKTMEELKEDAGSSPLEPAATPEGATQQPGFPQIPGYRIIKELGKGGMGVVYQAEQTKLHRQVALKMIRGGFVERQEYRQRFLIEAEAVARLQHPNIVQIYEVGDLQQDDGSVSPFMALEFVTGPSLESHLQGKPLIPQAAAELIAQLAFAMQCAHEHHLVHRDLKPANVLLAPIEQGHSGLLQHSDSIFRRVRASSSFPFVPKITDFGLAKQIDVDSSQTKAGEIMGTPSYMAPEQAQAKSAVGPPTDTYALGAILYELLTGRPPFRAVTSLDTLLMVIEDEPVPPSRLQPRTPKDLETICLKCLAKPIAKRYASAAELGEDLQRYLNQEPIKARPVTVTERVWKWAKRRPAVAALVVVSILALVTLIAGGIVFNEVVREERDVAIDAKKDAQTQRNDALKAKRQADTSATETQRTLDFFAVANGLQQIDQGNLYRGLLWCSRPLQETGAYREDEGIFRERLSHFLHFANRPTLLQIFFPNQQISHAAFSADGKWIVTSHDDKSAQVWESATGQAISPMLKDAGGVEAAFTSDKHRLLTVGGNAAQLWDTKTWKPAVAALKHTGPVQHARFSPDCTQIVTASHDHTARFWSATTGEEIGPPLKLDAEVNDVVFGLNGKVIATASGKVFSKKGEIRLWDAKTHQPLAAVMTYPDAVLHLAVSADGKTLAGISWDGTIRFWDLPTGAARGLTLKISEGPRKIMFNPEGTHLAATSQSWNVNIFEVSTGRLLQNLNQADIVYGMDYTKDGKWIVSHGEDKTARVWDAKSGDPVTPSLPHRGAVTLAVWHPSGRQLLTCSDDGTARLWDVPSRQARPIELKNASWVWVVAVSADGTTLATGGDNKDVRLWKLPHGEPIGEPIQFPGLIRELVFHPTKNWLAICGEQNEKQGEHNEAHVVDLSKRALALPPLKHSKRIISVRFSPDGKWLATTSLDGSAKIWSADDGQLAKTLTHKSPVISVSFSSDAALVLTTCGDGTVRLWDLASGKERFAPWKHGDAPVVGSAFSPDGQWAATCSHDYTAKIWNVKTGQAMQPPLQHQYEVMTLAFHPNSHRLVTGSYDKTGRIWDVETCQSIGPPLQHQGWVTQALFSPDGHLVATTSRDRSARLWDSSSGQAVSPPLPHEGRPVTECFTPDGRLLITGAFDKIARIWAMPDETRPTADLIDLIQLYDGHRMTRMGGVEQLTNDEMKKLWQRLQAKYPQEFTSKKISAP